MALLAGLLLLVAGLSSPLVCVPASCAAHRTAATCALDWAYQVTSSVATTHPSHH